MKKLRLILIAAFIISICTVSSFAQTITPGADLVSRYLWRGKDFGASPAVQPALTFQYSGFKLGAWGSLTTNDSEFQEQDLFVSYTFMDMFTIGVTDYFFPNDKTANNKYFHYEEDNTGHVLEANFKFEGLETLPLTLSINYNFYGADKDNSIYAEAAYTTKIAENKFDVFMGLAFDKGAYGNDLGVVNFGVTAYKEIKFTDSFALPVFARFITNPQAENMHLVFGLSL